MDAETKPVEGPTTADERLHRSAAEQEFLDWVARLEPNSLTEGRRRLLATIKDNFAKLEPLGTANGARARLLVELLDGVSGTLAADSAPKPNRDAHLASRLLSLTVGGFRGFNHVQHIQLDRDYVFIHGPNGSGKSSLCQAFEYVLTGGLMEAQVRGYKEGKFIKRRNSEQKQEIELIARDKHGKEGRISEDWRYRFALIEGNRIDDFARLPAASPAVQRERLAALFGLTDFSRFVDGFTADLERYLSLANDHETPLGKIVSNIESFETQIARANEALSQHLVDFNALCSKAECCPQSDDDPTAAILVLERLAAEAISASSLLEPKKAADPSSADSAASTLAELDAAHQQLRVLSLAVENAREQVDYKRLYEAVISLETACPDRCPACLTPTTELVKDPYDHARDELLRLEELGRNQREIECKKRAIGGLVTQLAHSFTTMEHELGKASSGSRELGFDSTQLLDQTNLDSKTIAVARSYVESAKETMSRYNAALDQEPEKQVSSAAFAAEASALRERIELAAHNLRCLEAKLSDELSQKTVTQLARDKRQVEVEQSKTLLAEYKSLIADLRSYRDGLPAKLAANLSQRTLAYFNHVKSKSFGGQLLEHLTLPDAASAPIVFSIADDPVEYEALHVLSEGNLKCLGVCVLLAKAVAEGLDFIIFDDIVNALDDHHIEGVASLLLEHEDFASRQLLVTCHGQLFIDKLVQKLGPTKSQECMRHYYLQPAEALNTAGIVVGGSGLKHHVVLARNHLLEGNAVSAEAECRIAVEQQMWALWRKISSEVGESIGLAITYGTPPRVGLHDLATALRNKLQGIKTRSGDEKPLVKELEILLEKYSWSLLNKAMHRPPELPELDLQDVEAALNLIEAIEVGIRTLKFEVFSRAKGGTKLKSV